MSTSASNALGLGISGFVTGGVPVIGAVLGGAGVAFGIAALKNRRRQDRAQALTGLVLGAWGTVTSLVAVVVVIAVMSLSASTREEIVDEALAAYGLDDLFGSPVAAGSDADEPLAVDEPVERDVAPAPPVGDEGFPAMSDAGFAAVVGDPLAHVGQQNRVFGEIQYVDQYDGYCDALIIVDDAQQTDWEEYAFPAWAVESTAVSCDDLAALGEYPHVALDVTWRGSTTTHWDDDTVDDVLLAEIAAVTLLPPLEY